VALGRQQGQAAQGLDAPGLTQAPPKPAKAPIGSDTNSPAPKPAKALIGSECIPQASAESTTPATAPTRSACRALYEVIFSKVQPGFSAQRIYHDLVAEHGFEGSCYRVRRFVRTMFPGPPRVGKSHLVQAIGYQRTRCCPAT
jgi:hypothetical protein